MSKKNNQNKILDQKKIKQIKEEEHKRSRAEASTETQLMSLNTTQDITCV
jgi:hypothetical protein